MYSYVDDNVQRYVGTYSSLRPDIKVNDSLNNIFNGELGSANCNEKSSNFFMTVITFSLRNIKFFYARNKYYFMSFISIFF